MIGPRLAGPPGQQPQAVARIGDLLSDPADQPVARRRHRLRRHEQRTAETAVTKRRVAMLSGRTIVIGEHVAIRSEEHTSELQSLMRTSYAVFCLKKIKIIANI